MAPQSRQQDAGDLEWAAQSQQLSAGDLGQGRKPSRQRQHQQHVESAPKGVHQQQVAGQQPRRALINSRSRVCPKGAHQQKVAGQQAPKGARQQQVAGQQPRRALINSRWLDSSPERGLIKQNHPGWKQVTSPTKQNRRLRKTQ